MDSPHQWPANPAGAGSLCRRGAASAGARRRAAARVSAWPRRSPAGWTAERCAAAAEAITLHLNPSVPSERGAEAHLMHDGVLLDAVGLRAWEIRRDALERVRSRHPRLRISQEGRRLLAGQARAIPGCRVAAALGTGFGLALQLGPWQD